MKALRFARFGDPSVLELVHRGDGMPEPADGEIVVEVRAASINPSDVKNVAGQLQMTTLPRTPGRDFAGIVADGPSELVGLEVWGAGGELGFTRDGTHAEYVVVPRAAAVEKPKNLSFAEAAAAGVAYVTAWHGLIDALHLKVGQTVIVTGSSGSVGMAAIQIARWMGVRTIGLDRTRHDDLAPALRADVSIFIGDGDLEEKVRQAAAGHEVSGVFDAVGAPVFARCLSLLGPRGRYALVSNTGPEPTAAFDLTSFYRRRLTLVGIDTLGLDILTGAKILRHLRPGFENGSLHPPAISRTVTLAEARTAYQLPGFSGKTVIDLSEA